MTSVKSNSQEHEVQAQTTSRGSRAVKGGGLKILCVKLRRFESCPRHSIQSNSDGFLWMITEQCPFQQQSFKLNRDRFNALNIVFVHATNPPQEDSARTM